MSPHRRLRIAALLLTGTAAWSAAAKKPPLESLPADKLALLPELLRHGDLALLESHPNGRLKQIAAITFVAAPPQQVHDVVADLGKWSQFVRNMADSTVTRNADGTVDQHFVFRYSIISLNGTTRSRFLPPSAPPATAAAPAPSAALAAPAAPVAPGAIDQEATDPEDNGHFRWEFIPAAGGTVLVMYGFVDVLHSTDLIRSAVKRAPPLEHGFALAAQLVQLQGMRQRAEQLAGPQPVVARPKAPGFSFLLDRGQVAVLRSSGSRFADLSLLDRVRAPRDKVGAVAGNPAAWSSFMDATPKSRELRRDTDGVLCELETSLPLASWDSRFLVRRDEKGNVDGMCVEGDLKGARFRYDLSPLGDDRTLVVYRLTQDLGAASLVFRTLFGQEPRYEHAMNVALGLVALNGVKARAEGTR